jgi:uncharacterized OB-fold protein
MEYPITYRKYDQGLARGEFLGLQCKACGCITFPPMALCRECSGSEMSPVSLSGKGRVRTFTVVRVAPEGKAPPYIVAMVELEEGPYVMGNLMDVNPDQASMDLMGKEVHLGSRLMKGDIYSIGDAHALTFSLVH